MSKDAKTPLTNRSQAAQPKFKMRGAQQIFHHLFKATLGKCLKNISFKRGVVDIHQVEHVHFFHSVNSMGMPQRFTNMVAGHFHEITWEIGPNGEPVAKCGPALMKQTKRLPDGTSKTNNVQVKWRDEMFVDPRSGEQGRDVIDNHTHQMLYMGTDELSNDRVRAIQEQNAKVSFQDQGTVQIKNKETGEVEAELNLGNE